MHPLSGSPLSAPRQGHPRAASAAKGDEGAQGQQRQRGRLGNHVYVNEHQVTVAHGDIGVPLVQAVVSQRQSAEDACAVGAGVYRVRVTVANIGGFSTNVMKGGGTDEVRKPVRAELEMGDGMELLSRVRRFEFAVLGDRGGSAEAEWFVRAPNGGSATIVAGHPRAGTVRLKLALQE